MEQAKQTTTRRWHLPKLASAQTAQAIAPWRKIREGGSRSARRLSAFRTHGCFAHARNISHSLRGLDGPLIRKEYHLHIRRPFFDQLLIRKFHICAFFLASHLSYFLTS
jgi:hypothetical protein